MEKSFWKLHLVSTWSPICSGCRKNLTLRFPLQLEDCFARVTSGHRMHGDHLSASWLNQYLQAWYLLSWPPCLMLITFYAPVWHVHFLYVSVLSKWHLSFCCVNVIFHHWHSSLALKGKTIIFSIHQPRFSIYRHFDKLHLLSKGKTVYHGQADQALDFFAQAGTYTDTFSTSISQFGPSLWDKWKKCEHENFV